MGGPGGGGERGRAGREGGDGGLHGCDAELQLPKSVRAGVSEGAHARGAVSSRLRRAARTCDISSKKPSPAFPAVVCPALAPSSSSRPFAASPPARPPLAGAAHPDAVGAPAASSPPPRPQQVVASPARAPAQAVPAAERSNAPAPSLAAGVVAVSAAASVGEPPLSLADAARLQAPLASWPGPSSGKKKSWMRSPSCSSTARDGDSTTSSPTSPPSPSPSPSSAAAAAASAAAPAGARGCQGARKTRREPECRGRAPACRTVGGGRPRRRMAERPGRRKPRESGASRCSPAALPAPAPGRCQPEKATRCRGRAREAWTSKPPACMEREEGEEGD